MARPDQVFINGNVLTMDTKTPQASAFAVFGDRFYAVGSDSEIRKVSAAGTKLTDLRGKTVIPGFIETHNHLSDYAMTLLQANCATPPNRSIEDVLSRIKAAATRKVPGEWVRGWGYDDTFVVENRHLTRKDLDKAAHENPVFIQHISGHLAYVNSLALEVSGIGADTPQPEGGQIPKDKNGIPTGLLVEESAQHLVLRNIPVTGISRIKKSLLQAVKRYHQAGITSIHDGSIGYYRDGRELLQAYRELETEEKLDLRVYLTIVSGLYEDILQQKIEGEFGPGYLKLGSVKLLQDGSIQALTAALMEPYYEKPDFRGSLIMAQGRLDDLVEKYHRLGLQIAVHANGDRAIESVLRAIEKACRLYPRKDHRHMIIHCQLATRDHICRMKEVGVIPSYFVNHIYYWGDRHVSRFLGKGRAQHLDPVGSSLEKGLIFGLHSDFPVTPLDPISSIHNAVNRTTRGGEVLGREECINPLEALKAYTINAAFCSFEEHLKGSITTGKLADFTILSGNPLNVLPERIKDIKVQGTFVGGRMVYSNP